MPRITQQEKAQNRHAILAAASSLFREFGVDQVGIDLLMSHAGLTRGGFYNHFDSKEALVAEACRCAFSGALGDLGRFLEQTDGPGSEPALARAVERYLSLEHRDALGNGCPAPALGGDLSRHGAEAQTQYAVGVQAYVALLGDLLAEAGHDSIPDSEGAPSPGRASDTSKSTRDKALETFALMVGSVVISRAVRSADPDLSEDVLRVARHALVDGEPESA